MSESKKGIILIFIYLKLNSETCFSLLLDLETFLLDLFFETSILSSFLIDSLVCVDFIFLTWG